ncbi:uncharacterized protein [Nicotiana tomentosiformis]|uniref:uncharacterized protein n=1 Tax=Nicotiana tomentosiformis TaxID=4098 RepID=UPI00388C9BC7
MNPMLLEARELPILRMMDFIQVKLQHWFYERRNEAEGTFYDVSCWVEEELKKKIDLAFTLNVFPVDLWRSRAEEEGITFLVDLNKRTSIEKRNIKKSNFCSDWYLKESWLKTYERQIHPVGHTDSWIVPESIKSQIIKPPDFKVPPGYFRIHMDSLQQFYTNFTTADFLYNYTTAPLGRKFHFHYHSHRRHFLVGISPHPFPSSTTPHT